MEQNTKRTTLQKFQNSNTLKYKFLKDKYNNTNATKNKWNKIQIEQNAKIPNTTTI